MVITIYAPIFALLLVYLSAKVILLRRKYLVAVGDGGHPELQRAIRVQGNFSEYVPLAIFLIFLVEMTVQSGLLVHGLCILLLAGRLIHAKGLAQVKEKFNWRKSGMMITFAALVIASVILLVSSVIF